jgi:hypothetical protein
VAVVVAAAAVAGEAVIAVAEAVLPDTNLRRAGSLR